MTIRGITIKGIKLNATEGFVLFMLSFIVTSLACQIVWKWWPTLLGLALGSYITLAQLTIILFFESNSDNPWLKRTTILYAAGYCALCAISYHRGNELAFYGAYGGLIGFLTNLVKSVFTDAEMPMPEVTIPAAPPKPVERDADVIVTLPK